MGHATELAELSGVTLEIHVDAVPFMDGAREYANNWIFPGGSMENKRTYEGGVRFTEGISPEEQMLLFDAQTSGGLLIAVPADRYADFEAAMEAAEAPYWQIGTVSSRKEVNIIVTR